MKLKNRLALYSIFIFSVITLLISIVIYFSYFVQMEKSEQQALESKSLLAAIYYLERDELSILEHDNIQRQLQRAISRRNIAVFDASNLKKAGDMPNLEDISTDFIVKVRAEKNSFFSTSDYFYNGIYYHDNEGDFVVITRESKFEFNKQMQSLFHILIVAFFIGLIIIYLFSRFLGNIAYKPIIDIIDQIKDRDSKNFDEPIHLQRSYTEIEDLVQTYNHFVDRISQTFYVQKNFIDYVSHELRTPITALMGTLEVTNQRERNKEEYEQVILQLKQYTNDLEETLDHMMLLSGAKTSFDFSKLRIDEVLWKVIEHAILYHLADIKVDIQVENNKLLEWEGNEKLLELAFNNIVENAIKYSNNSQVTVILQEQNGALVIFINDLGIGISEEDLKKVKQNFYRGDNTKDFVGKGIGLSMANIIFSLHQIDLEIHSSGAGTEVTLLF